MEKKKKGIGSIFFLFLTGFVVITMAFLFLIFFKLHVTTFAVDYMNINSYNTFLSAIIPLSIPEENTEMFLYVNKISGIAGYDQNFDTAGTSTLEKIVDAALPGSCYRFSIGSKESKSKIVFEKITKFIPLISQNIPGFSCDTSIVKFRNTVPMPVIQNGKSELVNSELVIYGVGKFEFTSRTVESLISASAWPLVIRR